MAATERPAQGRGVNQIRAALPTRRHSTHPNLVPLLVVAGAVIVGNLPALIHRVTTDPLLITAYLTEPTSSILPGQPFIDPNSGYTTQALGHLAALDWLHGHIPWWNPFEGIGAPLAGEMQSGAFFPLTLLLVWREGLLLLQMVIELASGGAAYLLVRRLGLGRACSTAAGVAFALCGTYAWFSHAPIRPVALLPICLLGVELAFAASATAGRRGGWILLAIGLALSILAGFPETTFIDAVFLAWWSVLRAIETDRSLWLSIVRKLVAGVAAGLALAAPLLVAFADYLPAADTGPHTAALRTSVPVVGASQLVLPYALGPILAFVSRAPNVQTLTLVWGNVGGYLSSTLIAAALVGLVGARHRFLRIGLAVWIGVSLLRTFGFPPLVDLFAVIPGLRAAAFYRYANGSWELATVVLAGFGIDDVARSLVRRRTLVVAAAITFLAGVWATLASWSVLDDATTVTGSVPHHAHLYALGNLALVAVVLSLLVLGGSWAGRYAARRTGQPNDPPSAGPTAPPPGPDGHGRRHRRRGPAPLCLSLPFGADTRRTPRRLRPLAAGEPGHVPIRDPGADPAQLRLLLRNRPGQRERPATAQELVRLHGVLARPEHQRPSVQRPHHARLDRSDAGAGPRHPPGQLRGRRRALRGRDHRRYRLAGIALPAGGLAAMAGRAAPGLHRQVRRDLGAAAGGACLLAAR